MPSAVYKAGEIIFSEGDKADCAYLVNSGEVLIQVNAFGQKKDVARIKAPGLLGEMAIINSTSRSATAVAVSDVQLTIIDTQQLGLRLKKADPLLKLLLSVLIKRLRQQLHKNEVYQEYADLDEQYTFLSVEDQLNDGIKHQQMRLFLQPIFSIAENRIAGFESLLRWDHPTRGLLSPDNFIKLAEDSGLILPLGHWILLESCKFSQLLDLNENKAGVFHKSAFISVNVSAVQFEDMQFFDFLEFAFNKYDINPKRITLEITESSLDDLEQAKRWIEKAKSYGVRIALDDFGTGYSSLSCLQELNIDKVKIDQSFIRKMLNDEYSRNAIKFILDVSNKFAWDVIAEGVETQGHLQFLQALGCGYAQGYLISKPSHLDTFL